MSDSRRVPDASIYRLSLYHCYVSESLQTGDTSIITSGRLASELGFSEATVRRDLVFLRRGIGNPRVGYDPASLHEELMRFLGLHDRCPIIMIGTAEMLRALTILFPAQRYGLDPTRYYSELPGEVGEVVNGISVDSLVELPDLDPALGVSLAVVACSPGWVQLTVNLLAKAGMRGVLLLTPSIKVSRPDWMELTYVRMPCDLNLLACRCQMRASVSV